jgi:hypothetical protein
MGSRLVEQVVFGYRDGHELLASSIDLNPHHARELLPHLDGSFEDDTPHYLIGTSVPSVGRYLLARIWPAPEAPRPGAVWAHGLLFDFEAVTDGVARWLTQLRRPSFETLTEYEEPATEPAGDPAVQPVRELLVGLTWAALAAADQQPVVLWDPVEDAEPALLALLDSLPSSVRPGLSFRTRTRARLGPSRYELQVARGILGRSGQARSPVLNLRSPTTPKPPRWAELAVPTADGASARAFLAAYAGSDTHTRAHVAVLLRLWAALSEHEAPGEVLATLTGTFPDRDTVPTLRMALLGDAKLHQELWEVPDDERLAAVLASPNSFDWTTLGVRRRVRTLFRKRPDQALQLTLRSLVAQDSHAADEVLDLLAEEITPQMVDQLTEYPALIADLLPRRLDLLASPAVWRALPEPQALDLLHDIPVFDRPLDVARAIGASGREQLIAAAANTRLPLKGLVHGFLRVKRNERDLAPLVEASGEQLTRLVVSGELSRADAMSLLGALPESVLIAHPIHEYRSLARIVHDTKIAGAARAGAVLLALALLSKERAAADEVMRAVFAPVHRSLAAGKLPPESWERLDQVLPGGNSPDRAARTRQALLVRAREGQWSAHEIGYALEGAGNDAALLSRMLSRKHPLRNAIDSALDGIADLMR